MISTPDHAEDHYADGKIIRTGRRQWLPIAGMRVSPTTQREQQAADVTRLAAKFDLDLLGVPVVSLRDGVPYVVDGAHRILALREIGFGDLEIECHVQEGLTEPQEADRFLKENDRKAVSTFDKFRIGITAERAEECEIDRIVRSVGLRISMTKADNTVSAVGALTKAHHRGQLAVTLWVIHQAYGGPGLRSNVMDGLSLLCQRYGDAIDTDHLTRRLAETPGGVNGLLGKAERMREVTRAPQNQCIAAAALDLYNRTRRGAGRLAPWWREEVVEALTVVGSSARSAS